MAGEQPPEKEAPSRACPAPHVGPDLVHVQLGLPDRLRVPLMIALIAHLVGSVVLAVWFIIWLLDQLGTSREFLGAWRTTDGRWLVQYVDQGIERYAVGSDGEWNACDADLPIAWPTAPIEDESTLRYLRSHWAVEEQLRRERDARRARRARKWVKTQAQARHLGSHAESAEEPRVASASLGE